MTSTRERKERFIMSFPHTTHGFPSNGRRALSMYSDQGIDQLVADFIAHERLRIRINNENRRMRAPVRGADLSPAVAAE